MANIFPPGSRAAASVAFVLLMLSFLIPRQYGAEAATRAQTMVRPHLQATPLLPFLDYYIDESFSVDIEEAAAPDLANAFQPLVLEKLPRVEGIVWMRFVLSPLEADEKAGTFLLDMGQSVPGAPILYAPQRNELSGALEWRENIPAQRNILLLPEAGAEPLTCYIRMDGLPGIWFSPMIRTPQNAASNWSSLARTGAILALGVVLLLCLLRGLSENGQWRFWTALYVLAALAQALAGMPTVSGHVSLAILGAVLTPGIALMLLPHVGRHLLCAPLVSRSIDIQLLLLSLPGAALAILPLLPGFAWLDRWLDLWPAGTILFVPTALGAWIMGLPGARRFLLGCILPPLFVGMAVLGLDFGVPPNVLASLPLWGVAFSALLIAATRAPLAVASQERENNPAPTIPLANPLDDPNLRLVSPDAAGNHGPADPEPEYPGDAIQVDSLTEATQTGLTGGETDARIARERDMRSALADLLRESAELQGYALPSAARQHMDKLNAASQYLGELIRSAGETDETPPGSDEVFNLQQVLRSAHDAVAENAAQTGVSIAWHMPPHLNQSFRGDARRLKNVLALLLASAARASNHGAVRVSARRMPESPDPGHILFTIADNGSGFPPAGRSSLAVVNAWELAGANDGFLGIESGKHGATVTFSARFTPVEKEETPEASTLEPHIILASDDPARRDEIEKILHSLPCRVTVAANANEVLVQASLDPAALLIAHGGLATPAASGMTREFATLAAEAGFDHVNILAITPDDSQWHLLKPGGFTHAMIDCGDPETLRHTVAELADINQQTDPQPIHADGDAEPADDRENADAESATPAKMPILPDADTEAKNGASPRNAASEAANAAAENSNPSFEGPEWLESPEMEQIAEDITPEGGIIASQDEAGESADVANAQVAESWPITGKDSATPAETSQTGEKDADDASEPVPAGTSAPKTSLTDFIVGVERGEESENGASSRHAVNADQARDFVDSSLTLASSILSQVIAEDTGENLPGKEAGSPVSEGSKSDPVIDELARNLDLAMNAAVSAFDSQNGDKVAEAAAEIAREADDFGLRLLRRMAQCVERAARKNDFDALRDLLPELAIAVERNRIALTSRRK